MADQEEYEETELQLLTTLMDQSQALSLRRLLDEQHIPSVVLGGHNVNIVGCQPYQFYIDEDYLRNNGVTDFEQYAVLPGTPLLPDFFL